MKKLIIALALGLGLTGFAQETTPPQQKTSMEKLTPEQRQQKQLAHLTKQLALDAKQQEAVGKILADKSAKAQELKAQKQEKKSKGEKMTPEEKVAFKNKMQAEKTDTETRMKAILTADQYKKWVAIREENQEKMRQRMGNGGDHNRDGNNPGADNPGNN
jgi:hypothetical protein